MLTYWKTWPQASLTWLIARTRAVVRWVPWKLQNASAARASRPAARPATAARATRRDSVTFASMRLLHACERVRVADLPCVSIGRHARVLSEAGTRPGPATRRQPA